MIGTQRTKEDSLRNGTGFAQPIAQLAGIVRPNLGLIGSSLEKMTLDTPFFRGPAYKLSSTDGEAIDYSNLCVD